VSDALFRPPWAFGEPYPDSNTLESARVAVLPIPYDSTTEYKGGTREGPRAIVDASQYLELYDAELGQETGAVGIYTLPEVQRLVGDPQTMVERVQQVVTDLLEKDKLVAMLGGEHSLTVGAVRAFSDKYPGLSVLYLDAHADLRDEYMGTRYSHACAARRVWETCHIVQAGIRSLSKAEHDFIRAQGLLSYDAEAAAQTGFGESLASDLSEYVYISIDLDVLDPSIMAAVGTPEPGGLTWQQLTSLLKAVAQTRRMVGFDLVELSPSQGTESCAYLAAKLAYKLMGYATLRSPHGPGDG
jgi:agmatinase